MSSRGFDQEPQSTLVERALGEVRRFLVMFLYLWVLFALFVLNERNVLREDGIDFALHGFALLNAFVLAKVMLIVDKFHLARLLRKRPLIYSILFESFLLAVLFICFHLIEGLVLGILKGEGGRAGVPAIGGGGIAGLGSVAAILFVTLIPFFAFKNVERALGREQLRSLLFGPAKSR